MVCNVLGEMVVNGELMNVGRCWLCLPRKMVVEVGSVVIVCNVLLWFVEAGERVALNNKK